MSKWVIDHDALKKAKKILNLEHPIKVKLWHNSDGWNGEYRANPLHCVLISNGIKPHWEVSQTIWHELAHAMQCERDFNGDGITFGTAYESEYDRLDPRPTSIRAYNRWLTSYFAIPCEAEAEAIANRYYDRIPLVRSIA